MVLMRGGWGFQAGAPHSFQFGFRCQVPGSGHSRFVNAVGCVDEFNFCRRVYVLEDSFLHSLVSLESIQDRSPFELPFRVALKISGKKLLRRSFMIEIVMFG